LRFPCLTGFVFVALTLSAAPFPAAVTRYTGRWTLVPAASDNIDKAIETTVSSMNFVARPIARGRLKRRNVAFPSFQIAAEDRGLHVRHQQGLDVVYPSEGTAVHTRAPDNSDVTTKLATEPVLKLTYDAEGGRREDQYILSTDGSTLTMAVRIVSPNLPKPLVYRLAYRRSN
jgi:hypothetical protein